jgi:hypothetical protein
MEGELDLMTKIWAGILYGSIVTGIVMLVWPRPWARKSKTARVPVNWKWFILNSKVRIYLFIFIAYFLFLASPALFVRTILLVVVGLVFSVLWRIRNGEILNKIDNKDLSYLKDQPGVKYAAMRLFYKWFMTPKPEGKNLTFWNELIFIFKVLSARLYFFLGRKQIEFVGWVTQYYPFSLLWRERLYHSKNLKVRNLMDEIRDVAKKSGLYIILLGGGNFTDYCEMEGDFTRRVRNKALALKKLETCLIKTYKIVYVRELDRGFKLILPNNLIDS